MRRKHRGQPRLTGMNCRILVHGKRQICQSTPLRPTAGRTGADTAETAVRLGRLQPGEYFCQLTVVHAGERKFEVRRVPLAMVPGRREGAGFGIISS